MSTANHPEAVHNGTSRDQASSTGGGSGTTDRRVRRTRKLLRGALLSLIEEKGYQRITVQDILERADVGRSTFYAHYRDKDDLLLSGFEDIRSALAAEGPPTAEGSHRSVGFLEPTLVVFQHVEAHRHRWRPLVRNGGADLLLRMLHDNVLDLLRKHFVDQLGPNNEDPRIEAAVQFVVGACMGLLTWWVENDEVVLSAGEMHALFRGLAVQGVRRFLDGA